MKKRFMFFAILLFFLLPSIGCCFCVKENVRACSFVSVNNIKNYSYEFLYAGKIFKFETKDFLSEIKLSKFQKEQLKNNLNRFSLVTKLCDMGFSKKDAIDYAFPEIVRILEKLKQALNVDAENQRVQVLLNKCRLKISDGKKGRFLNLIDFYERFYDAAKKSEKIKFDLKVDSFESKVDLRKEFVEKGCFSTNFSSSSKERKNNIKKALSVFDGLVLEQGEVLSFNKTTGERTKENGYSPAKIISGGTFVEGFGGGVCQVSTTLYNACLLSGLEILEVHNHSLPVSYVEPSFDAMVNAGSSDLVVRNNTNGKLIFTTSCENDVCKVKIFGKKNKYKITRFSEKIDMIPAEEDCVETDFEKYGLFDLMVGEQKRLSYAKDGYHSNGYLNFYDSYGNLVETKKIRENKYNPVRGVVVKRVS